MFLFAKKPVWHSDGHDPTDSPTPAPTKKPVWHSDGHDVCNSSADCESNEYCAKEVDQCGGQGTCEVKPIYCTEHIMPVCGCDSTTYNNECEAQASGVNVWMEGTCSMWMSDGYNDDCGLTSSDIDLLKQKLEAATKGLEDAKSELNAILKAAIEAEETLNDVDLDASIEALIASIGNDAATEKLWEIAIMEKALEVGRAKISDLSDMQEEMYHEIALLSKDMDEVLDRQNGMAFAAELLKTSTSSNDPGDNSLEYMIQTSINEMTSEFSISLLGDGVTDAAYAALYSTTSSTGSAQGTTMAWTGDGHRA